MTRDLFSSGEYDKEREEPQLNEVDQFLKTYMDSTNKVIRKIDTVNKKVESKFCSLIAALIDIEKKDQFLKDQVKTNEFND
eukprot:CAMPEP_0170508154 /NCGR_PEP_ID=MMETSP0208-20121228/61450_1 /TAXON_ID=197538 /ORGANISM="Strombidium inclinatum, Strain S3" /LENGTH=80 /DNA_ID=CAMNT_0010790893 /DNA_START=290 /DNA_END=529 /DNA_ORIENTATION=-